MVVRTRHGGGWSTAVNSAELKDLICFDTLSSQSTVAVSAGIERNGGSYRTSSCSYASERYTKGIAYDLFLLSQIG